MYSAWEEEVSSDDPKRDFLLTGVREGFHIVDPDSIQHDVFMDNYKSATGCEHRHLVEQQIRTEILNKRYQIVSSPAKITSALGAIPKKDANKVRLIHDCSRPSGFAVNDYAYNNTFQYQTIQDAVSMISPNYFMAKIDLASAFRSVRIHPSNYAATGLHWTFDGDSTPTLLVDTRLPFGASRSPEVFNELGRAVSRMMSRKGHTSIVVYLDDFLVVGKTYSDCLNKMTILMKLLRKLGFAINFSKVEGPKQCITFLGIVLDSISMTLRLTEGRIQDLTASLVHLYQKPKATKRQLMSIAGKLNWVTQVIYGGRFHLRRLLDRISSLRMPWHRTRVTTEMRKDLQWWIDFLPVFNGTTPMLDTRLTTSVCIDACPIASGASYNGEFVYTPWACWQAARNHNISYKETMALEPAVVQWAPHWQNKTVYVHCDNQAAVYLINKGSSKDPVVMDSLRRVFWLSAMYNFRLKAVYLPGVHNQIADCISRLHEPNSYERLTMAIKSIDCQFLLPHRPHEGHPGSRFRQRRGALPASDVRRVYPESL